MAEGGPEKGHPPAWEGIREGRGALSRDAPAGRVCGKGAPVGIPRLDGYGGRARGPSVGIPRPGVWV